MTGIAKMLTGMLALVWSRKRRHPTVVTTCRDEMARDVNEFGEIIVREEEEAEAALGGCYHDGLAYSLGYDANGVVELTGKTFTNLSAFDGGAVAALRRHRQNFDPSSDVPQFIVALRPIKVIRGREDGEPYGLPPGPLAENPPVDENPHRTKSPDIPGCGYCTKPVGARYRVEETFGAKNACIEHAQQAKASGKTVNVHPFALEFADPVAAL